MTLTPLQYSRPLGPNEVRYDRDERGLLISLGPPALWRILLNRWPNAMLFLLWGTWLLGTLTSAILYHRDALGSDDIRHLIMLVVLCVLLAMSIVGLIRRCRTQPRISFSAGVLAIDEPDGTTREWATPAWKVTDISVRHQRWPARWGRNAWLVITADKGAHRSPGLS